MRLPAGLSPLRHRDFAIYWAGQCVSQVGTFIEITATSYLLYAITGSPVLLGIAGLARAIPLLTLALYGGALADRVDRKRLLIFTQACQVATSLVLGTLVATGRLEFWHIYIIGAVNSALSAFDAPARSAFYPSLIPRAEFQNAVTLTSVIIRLSRLLGPAIAGVLIASVGPASPFFLNAASYFGLIGALALIPSGPTVQVSSRPSMRAAMRDGLRYAVRSPILRLILGTEMIVSIFGHDTTLITIFAHDVLHAGPDGLGMLLSAVGAGAILGAVVLIGAGELQRKGAIMIGAGLCYALALLVFAFSSSFVLSAAALFALGLADSFWGAMRNTITQLAATDAFRGRITSLLTFANRGLTNAGQVETGAIVAAVGAPLGAAINAIVIVLAVVAMASRSSRLRAFTSSEPTDLGEAVAP